MAFLTFLLICFCLTFIYGAELESVGRANRVFNEKDNPHVGKWALLVSGSKGWSDYRHQADICHAYQILHAHGIPDERIVVMMYDDIAYNESNPDKGKVYNHPNGPDVYHDIPHDYVGEDVTPDNFHKILSGDKQAMQGIGSGKVIESDSDDHVFLYFADHGNVKVVAFPAGGYLFAYQLHDTLRKMWNLRKYGEMVIYMSACESGSMFDTFEKELQQMKIYVTTSANPTEGSAACYNDERLKTYLGDCYSVYWMEDSDKENLQKETLEEQYQIVKDETIDSHVQQYGDMYISAMHVSDYQGGKTVKSKIYPKAPKNPVCSRDVPLKILRNKIKNEKDPQKRNQYETELANMKANRHLFDRQLQELTSNFATIGVVSDEYNPKQTRSQMKCHEQLVNTFAKHCYNFSEHPYTMKSSKTFMSLCANDVNVDHAFYMVIDFCRKIKKPVGNIL